ncbi:isocitrate lyase/PEP mutase family protein [Nonomuraea africana]|uniref:2-methylisocitrate lyase-like PEP mutase family enzyme n=1 Tax=Nonomuraea africana TaxID=46171 RepID=A0ABR9KJ35_9ACTN|nr:isocitrate lyase/phosphoenolpyruvate mutase family protein [Nonomuraea africana]MBE1561825.1 2-methylisocitrate lyase-like PEP mutase family enzyme [Nonomuraea africana]
MNAQRDRALLFRSLHVPGRPLLLANAWDAASAAIVAAAGAPAVATTSAGVAWSLGSPDGDRLGATAARDLVARVTAAVTVPVTADIEGGYAEDAAGVARTVREVLDAGAVGVNLEDADPARRAPLRTIEAQAVRLAAARAAADEAGIPMFLNARIDTYLAGGGDLGETLERALAYVEAGADGVFVPGLLDLPAIATLTGKVGAPLNVLTGPGAPDVAALAGQGVARVSLGSAVAQAAYGVARRAALELYGPGTYTSLDGAIPYPELNALLDGGAS